MNAPALIDMLETLVAAPSVSCTSTALDQSNLTVIHHLAEWLEGLGFVTDVAPHDELLKRARGWAEQILE